MQYTYLLINIAILFFPLVLSFDRKVRFINNWKFVFGALGVSGLVFLLWDIVFAKLGVWTFNPDYIMGFYVLGLPLEEILFFLTVPFACLFIYECLNVYFPDNKLEKFSLSFSNLLLGVCLAFVFFAYSKWYSVLTFSVLLLLLLYVEYVNTIRFMYRFYRLYLVSLIPFFIVNGFLTGIPVVSYNDAETLKLRVGSIPLEDHFYLMALLLLNVYLYEHFKRKYAK